MKSPARQAFEGLRVAGRAVRRPDLTLAVPDHNLPTTARVDAAGRELPIADFESAQQLAALRTNVAEFDVPYIDALAVDQGIVHVVGPEQGFTLPGTTLVCGDSHTAAHGALGALAFGIGTSEVEHVLATQTLLLARSRTMEIRVDGTLGFGVAPKDVILAIVGRVGAAGGTGYVVEYTGSVIRAMSVEGRLTVSNMAIEHGARSGLIAPDEATFAYLKGRPMAPAGANWDAAVEYWRTLPSDAGARYDATVRIDAGEIAPSLTWGTSPEDVVPITGMVPDPDSFADPAKREAARKSLAYMGLTPGTAMQDVGVGHVFIGSCTNSRIEDLRAAASVANGRHVADGVRALVVPGSGLVKRQAEAEGLDRIFTDAGFEWREPGCSMCLAMNPDKVPPGERCAVDVESQFRGATGSGRAHASVESGDGGGGGGDRAAGGCPRADGQPMNPVVTVQGRAYPWGQKNVDTDVIIPAHWLKTITRTGLGKGAFETVRAEPDNLFDDPRYAGAPVLVAGDNFGCGSSREHAAWALADMGVKAVIAPSFSDIFSGNAFKNGIVTVVLPQEAVDRLVEVATTDEITIDLETMTVTTPFQDRFEFSLDPFRRQCLMEGLDEVGLTLARDTAISKFESADAENRPWISGRARHEGVTV